MAEETQEGRTFLVKDREALEKRSTGLVACMKTCARTEVSKSVRWKRG